MPGQPLERRLSVAQLRPVLRGCHGDHTVDQPAGQSLQHAGSLHGAEGRGGREIQAQLHR